MSGAIQAQKRFAKAAKQGFLDDLVVIDRLEVGPVVVEPRRVSTTYTVVVGTERTSTKLRYRFEEDVFDTSVASKNLAAMMTAQVALTRGAAQGPAARSRGDDDALAGVRLGSHPVWGETQDVVVAEVLPGSHAARAGLEPGDVITAVNRQLVETTRDIDRALEQAATTAIRPRPGPIAGSGPVNRWSSR